MARRSLDFQNTDELIQDIEHLRQVGYQKLGNWSLTQICEHLEKVTRGGMDGFDFKFPWIIRATIGRYFVSKMLRTRKVPSLSAPKVFLPKPAPAEGEDDSVIDRCLATSRRMKDFAGPFLPYPLATGVTLEDWRQIMLVHGAHHLSFLVPKS